MKIYRGYRDGHGFWDPIVVTVTENGQTRPLKHYSRHSEGFEWGYLGSGPADLARSILADHFGRIPHPQVYQRFNLRFVSRWDRKYSWSISTPMIERWLEEEGFTQLSEEELFE